MLLYLLKGNTMKTIIKNACNLIQSESAQSAVDSGYRLEESNSFPFRFGYTLAAFEGLLIKLDLSEEQLLILQKTYANKHFIVS